MNGLFAQIDLSTFFEWLIYAAVALVTLIGVFKCIVPVLHNAHVLNRGITRLEKRLVSGERPPWREARFLGKSLRDEWRQFLQNAAQLEVRGIPCDLENYINDDSVIDKPGHSQLAELIPSLLTSLGILGTFLGLMIGLSTVNFGSAQGTIDSIETLLTNMKLAFSTSVAGISCSLAFNIVHRMAVGKAMRALDHFEDSFYELAMPRPLQQDVQLLCQKQDEDARTAALVEKMSAQVAASIEDAVGRAMLPLTRSLDTFIHGATQEQVDGIRRVAGQFVLQMNSALSDQFVTLGKTLETVNQSQLKTQSNLDATVLTIETMNQHASQICQACQETADKLSLLNAVLDDRQLEGVSQKLETLMNSLEVLKQSVDEAAAELGSGKQQEE